MHEHSEYAEAVEAKNKAEAESDRKEKLIRELKKKLRSKGREPSNRRSNRGGGRGGRNKGRGRGGSNRQPPKSDGSDNANSDIGSQSSN